MKNQISINDFYFGTDGAGNYYATYTSVNVKQELKKDFEEKHTAYAEKIVRRIIEG